MKNKQSKEGCSAQIFEMENGNLPQERSKKSKINGWSKTRYRKQNRKGEMVLEKPNDDEQEKWMFLHEVLEGFYRIASSWVKHGRCIAQTQGVT